MSTSQAIGCSGADQLRLNVGHELSPGACFRAWKVFRLSCSRGPSTEYRQHAKECRGLANQSRLLEHRQMLLNIAATWESLANDRIKTAEGLERIAKLEKTARKSRKPSYAC